MLLLIDNFDLVLERLTEHHWEIRETLQSEVRLMVIGASCQATEATFNYGAAFYDFFRLHELKRLTLTETHAILRNLADFEKAPHVIELIDTDPARINALHTLTGGNPRTIVLLFKVLSRGMDGDVRSDLENLLDMVTPLYKARFEELPNLSQQLVGAMALHWDPMTAQAIAIELSLSVNLISAQLNRLTNQGVIEKVAPARGKRLLFQISERFFNIWYLMRASRRVRRKLIWLVYFLKIFFSPKDLSQRAEDLLKDQNLSIDNAQGNRSFNHIRFLLTTPPELFPPAQWSYFLDLCQEIIASNKTKNLLELMDDTQARHHWRPLREAVAAILENSLTGLNGVAPEIRDPAIELVKRLAPNMEMSNA